MLAVQAQSAIEQEVKWGAPTSSGLQQRAEADKTTCVACLRVLCRATTIETKRCAEDDGAVEVAYGGASLAQEKLCTATGSATSRVASRFSKAFR